MCNKMSEVRLSNASPTVERVEARQPDAARPSVRRNLFGPPDPEEIRSNVDTMIRDDVQGFKEKYNFDPVAHRPLPTRNYDWQVDLSAPEFYRRPHHGRRRPRQDAGDRSGGQAAQPNRDATRKRRSGASGSCSSESQSKKSRTNEKEKDDDDDEDHGAGSQAVKAAEESPSRPENGAEVQ